eukprot:4763051-Ditylum_brightwellii.AAC.1
MGFWGVTQVVCNCGAVCCREFGLEGGYCSFQDKVLDVAVFLSSVWEWGILGDIEEHPTETSEDREGGGFLVGEDTLQKGGEFCGEVSQDYAGGGCVY